MELEEKKKILEKVTKKLLEELGIKGNVIIVTNALSEDNKDSVSVEIESEESSYLIGKFGINLNAFQHICRLLVRKETDEKVEFTVDVNNYRQRQMQNILNTAKEAIDKAIATGDPVELPPMNAYERRIIHMEVSKNDEVKSESLGEDEDRRVKILLNTKF